MPRLTHIDDKGAAHMVDVSGKAETVRQAVATGRIVMNGEALRAIAGGSAAKGDVLAVARIAGIMAAKKTSELIPLCHPLPINKISLDLEVDDEGLVATATVRTQGRTGVEMEAMTAVSVALLTVYDMAKSLDKAMIIKDIRLLEKSGGKSGDWRADEQE
ncbi:cyclic pyranopterin monophosphate synthase accessory protein [Sphingobium jiangsuense]|uniref:Cyclic pyranopterin monophosphate synthase n=1 Tax=Sphingobium jiangsuense TaxID=870476 RepID=A0A7W6BJN4_9SPHN|nr:cyclic pyranopterin monophosphate synthase MoaC [Sphingobium jiangsuense]MBB3924910.1 cyclic pyranopterin phosphate synthase [Sphingobium jiangsuense]GLS99594.1 cyclic pyranopterin monophosphate synthase accessory protein [Sphingobium jiangsuense]